MDSTISLNLNFNMSNIKLRHNYPSTNPSDKNKILLIAFQLPKILRINLLPGDTMIALAFLALLTCEYTERF